MTKRHEKKTILVIEDEAEIRHFISRVLELEGYRPLQAADGEEGLELVKTKYLDAVLLDLQLPGIDGWSVIAELKGDPAVATIPVVILTASDVVSQRDRALSMGAADYLVKPITASTLAETVRRILCKYT